MAGTINQSTTNTLMDNVHNLTFTFILLIVSVIIYSLNLFESGDEEKRNGHSKLAKRLFFVITFIYLLMLT